MIAIPLIFIIFLILGLKYYLWKRHMESYVQHLPTIRSSSFPLIGNACKFLGKSTSDLFRGIIKFIQTNETPTKIWIGPVLTITLDKPEDVKAVLMSPNCLDKPYMYRFLPSDVGILTAKCKAFSAHFLVCD